jgi:hypothetical protein
VRRAVLRCAATLIVGFRKGIAITQVICCAYVCSVSSYLALQLEVSGMYAPELVEGAFKVALPSGTRCCADTTTGFL